MTARLLILFPLLLALGSCTVPGPDSCNCIRPDAINEGKAFLSNFEGARARDTFLAVNADYGAFSGGKDHCEAAYGVVLADIQIILARVNPVILKVVEENLRPRPSTGIHALSADLGADIASVWDEVAPTVLELAEYAAAVTAIPDCAFSIGLNEPVTAVAVDYKFVANFLDNEKPVAQVILQSKFDGVEARLIGALAHVATGIADLLLAHDLAFELDAAKVALQLGVTEACVAKGIVPCYLGGADAIHPPIDLLNWAFVLADNPDLLSRSPARWGAKIGNVDNDFAQALSPLRSLFGALMERNDALFSKGAARDEYGQYTIIYEDSNHNGFLDQPDRLGLNVTDFRLRCEALIGTIVLETDAEDCGKRLLAYQDIAQVGLLFLKTAASPSESVIGELQLFLDRVYFSLKAVDEPAQAYERIPFDSFSGLFTELFPVLDEPAPNFLALDLKEFLSHPVPIRQLLPAWESTVGGTGARFLADADDYDYVAAPPTTVTTVDVYLNEAYGGMLWGLLGRPVSLSFVPDSVRERALFGCEPGGKCIPRDCLNATNLYTPFPGIEFIGLPGEETWRWPVLYLWFEDPGMNGLLYTDASVWSSSMNSGGGNGASSWAGVGCEAPTGWKPADNLSLQKSLWLFADFFLDHFQLAGLLKTGLP